MTTKLEDDLGQHGVHLAGMIGEPFCSSGNVISPRPARGPLAIHAMSPAILVNDTAMVFSAPESSTRSYRLAYAYAGL